MNALNKYFEQFLLNIELSSDVRENISSAWLKKKNQTEVESIINSKAEKEVSKAKRKSKKGGIKKGKSAYIFFSGEERAKIKKEIEDGIIDKLDNQQIMGELAARWKIAQEGDISKYEKLAAADKERYESEKQNSSASEGETFSDDEVKSTESPAPKKKSSSKKKVSSDTPKKNKSAYMFFCDEQRPIIKEENPDIKSKEIMSVLAERWNALKNGDDTDELQRYFDMASEDKERYTSSKVEEPAKKTEAKKTEAKKTEPKKTEPKKKKVATKKTGPKKNKTAFNFFCSEERENAKSDNPDMSTQEIQKELATRWKVVKEIPDKVKYFNDLAAEDKVRYENEIKETSGGEEEEDEE